MDERTPSFLFDVFRWPEHPELEAVFNRLWDAMPKSRIRSTVEKTETLSAAVPLQSLCVTLL